jgi:hypothetical protein
LALQPGGQQAGVLARALIDPVEVFHDQDHGSDLRGGF